MKHLSPYIILLFSLTGFGQANHVILGVFNQPHQPAYFVPSGDQLQVMNDQGIFVVNKSRMEFYQRMHKLFKDPAFVKGISVANLDRLEQLAIGQDSLITELVKTTRGIYNLATTTNDLEKNNLLRLETMQQEQKNLLLELADKQEDLLTNELGKLERKAKRNRTFRKVLGGVCIAGAGYIVLKNGVDTMPEQIAAGVLGGAGIIAVVF